MPVVPPTMNTMFAALFALVLIAAITAIARPVDARAALDYFGAAPQWQPTLTIPVDHYVGCTGHDDDGADSVTLCTGSGPNSLRGGATYGRDPSAPASMGMPGMAVHNDPLTETAPAQPAGTEAPTRTAEPATPPIDQEAIARAVATAIAEREAAQPAPEVSRAPDLNPNAGTEEDGSRVAVSPGGELVSFRGRAMSDLTHDERDALGNALYRLVQAQTTGNYERLADATDELARMGHYGPEAREAVQNGQRAMSTLTDSDGGVFLPEVVLNEVMRLVPNYGIIRRRGRVIPVGPGSVRVPNLAAGVVAFWTGETAGIKARKAAFDKTILDPEGMGVIVPWTNELEEETGSAFLDLIVTLVSEAFALLEDQAGLYGDGTADFGGITGLANAAGVAEVLLGTDAASGATFDKLTADAMLRLKFAASSRVRGQGVYVIHPDNIEYLLALKDTQGRYLLKMPTEDGMLPTIWGSPVEFTEAAHSPALSAANQAEKSFVFYGDFSRFLVGQGRGITSDLLTEATINDVDDSTPIRLGAQNMKGLRVTQRVDMAVALAAAFSRLKTRPAA